MADDSKASNVGGRYAQALFDLANDENKVAKVAADLNGLKAALADSRDLRVLIASPAFSNADKAKGLDAIAARAKLDSTTRKFLGLLAVNGRAAALLRPGRTTERGAQPDLTEKGRIGSSPGRKCSGGWGFDCIQEQIPRLRSG